MTSVNATRNAAQSSKETMNGYQSMMKTAKMLQTFENSCNLTLDFWICFFLINKKLKNLNTFQIETLFKDPENGQNSKEKTSEKTPNCRIFQIKTNLSFVFNAYLYQTRSIGVDPYNSLSSAPQVYDLLTVNIGNIIAFP